MPTIKQIRRWTIYACVVAVIGLGGLLIKFETYKARQWHESKQLVLKSLRYGYQVQISEDDNKLFLQFHTADNRYIFMTIDFSTNSLRSPSPEGPDFVVSTDLGDLHKVMKSTGIIPPDSTEAGDEIDLLLSIAEAYSKETFVFNKEIQVFFEKERLWTAGD